MKQFLTLIFIISISTVSFALEVQKSPIVDIEQVQEFGLWRVYNEGDNLYFVDSLKGRIVDVNNLFYYPSTDDNFYYFFFAQSGGASLNDATYPTEIITKSKVNSTGLIQTGFFGYKNMRISVKGDSVLIFPIANNNYDAVNDTARFKMVLNKFSNRILVQGPQTETNFEPNVTLTPSNIPAPIRVLGNCEANYNITTGVLKIPCFSIGGARDIYEVDLKQLPAPDGVFNFNAELPTFKKIQ